MDNQTVYRKLKAFLIDSPGWAWIEPHDNKENGRNAYLAWIAHYTNGEGELSKRTALAKAKLENLHYKNERSMSFERCAEIMTKCFNTLHKDPDQIYSDQRKLEKLLKAICCTDRELIAANVFVDQQHGCVRLRWSLRLLFPTTTSFQSPWTSSAGWSTAKPNPVNAAFMPALIDKQAAADGDEDAMAAEVDEAADADGRMITEAGEGVIISLVSILLTLTEASRGANGIHWDPKVAPPCFLCEIELKTEAAATMTGWT
jgi:hypothetical protein